MMIIKKKSETKGYAAQILINNHYYIESVHCSYYAVLLYMKHILCNLKDEKSRITYEIQFEKGKEYGSSHDYILKEIAYRVTNPKNRKYISEEFRVLKQKRVLSDYDVKIFDEMESIEAKEQSDGLIRKLKDSIETTT